MPAGSGCVPVARGRVRRVPHRQLEGVPQVEEVLEVIVLGEDANTVTLQSCISNCLGAAVT